MDCLVVILDLGQGLLGPESAVVDEWGRKLVERAHSIVHKFQIQHSWPSPIA